MEQACLAGVLPLRHPLQSLLRGALHRHVFSSDLAAAFHDMSIAAIIVVRQQGAPLSSGMALRQQPELIPETHWDPITGLSAIHCKLDACNDKQLISSVHATKGLPV